MTDHLVLQYIFDAAMCPTPIRVAGECLFKVTSDTFSEIRVSFELYYHISSAYVWNAVVVTIVLICVALAQRKKLPTTFDSFLVP